MAGKAVYRKFARKLGSGVAANDLAKGFLYGSLDGAMLDSLALLYRAENKLTEKKVGKTMDKLSQNVKATGEWASNFEKFHYEFMRDFVMPHARRQDAEISRIINKSR